jgi:Polyketide cyclase / dehydrase and lipid transport
MPSYAFATIWRLAAPIDRVFELIHDAERWPSWWPSVRAVQPLPRDPSGRDRFRFTFRGRLPYLLRFDMTITRDEPPTELVGLASGELEGEGHWSLREDGTRTVLRYDWTVRTTRRWMDLLAPLPFVDEIFALNHHAVMRDGLAGARRVLGVSGSYERLD